MVGVDAQLLSGDGATPFLLSQTIAGSARAYFFQTYTRHQLPQTQYFFSRYARPAHSRVTPKSTPPSRCDDPSHDQEERRDHPRTIGDDGTQAVCQASPRHDRAQEDGRRAKSAEDDADGEREGDEWIPDDASNG